MGTMPNGKHQYPSPHASSLGFLAFYELLKAFISSKPFIYFMVIFQLHGPRKRHWACSRVHLDDFTCHSYWMMMAIIVIIGREINRLADKLGWVTAFWGIGHCWKGKNVCSRCYRCHEEVVVRFMLFLIWFLLKQVFASQYLLKFFLRGCMQYACTKDGWYVHATVLFSSKNKKIKKNADCSNFCGTVEYACHLSTRYSSFAATLIFSRPKQAFCSCWNWCEATAVAALN